MTDRDAALKKADRLLREGRADQAVAEYRGLVERHPGDWNLVNALGDAYLRAGDPDRAAAQFVGAADGLWDQGVVSRAGALYKKALKVRHDHEHALSRLATLAAGQGLLVEARRYLRKLADAARARGDERAVADCLDRLAELEGTDAESKIRAARVWRSKGDAGLAAALLRAAARAYEAQGRAADALSVWVEAADADPRDAALATRLARELAGAGDFDRARRVLGDDAHPDRLLALVGVELAAGNGHGAREAASRLLAAAPDRHPELVHAARERGHAAAAAFGVVEVVVDTLVASDDWAVALRALQAFAADVPHIGALIRLVELAIEIGDDALMRWTQARLCDAYLEAGRAAEARVLAEDLVAARPDDVEHAHRLRRVLNALGAGGDAVSGRLDAFVAEEEPVAPARQAEPLVPIEVDLSDFVTASGDQVAPEPVPGAAADGQAPEDLDAVFGRLRDQAARERYPDASQRYERGLRLLGEGRIAEAIADLEEAARAPTLRFKAAARLGRVHLASGDLEAGANWLDLAAEAAAPEPEEARSVLYDLADTLERLGERDRALAIMIELDAESGGYRDVRARIERLTRAGSGRAEA